MGSPDRSTRVQSVLLAVCRSSSAARPQAGANERGLVDAFFQITNKLGTKTKLLLAKTRKAASADFSVLLVTGGRRLLQLCTTLMCTAVSCDSTGWGSKVECIIANTQQDQVDGVYTTLFFSCRS